MRFTTTVDACDSPLSPIATSWNTRTGPSALSSFGVCLRSLCDLCEETYYEPTVTDAIVQLLEETDVAPGQARRPSATRPLTPPEQSQSNLQRPALAAGTGTALRARAMRAPGERGRPESR